MRWGKQVSNQGWEMTGNYRGGDGVIAHALQEAERETEKIREKVVNTGPTSGSSSQRERLLSF